MTLDPAFSSNTREIQHLPDAGYDRLLTESVVFVELYDASANNAVIECIARATPILVNPLPAVVEYLGDDYPMYFSTLCEAAAKALDTTLIHDTNIYLTRCDTRSKLSGDHFRHSFEESEVYRMLQAWERARCRVTNPCHGAQVERSEDGTIRLWDVASGQPLGAPLGGFAGQVSSVAFSPDGKTLVVGAADGTVRLWDINVRAWPRRACRIANRNLTRQEWRQQLGNLPYHPTCPGLPAGL